MKENFSFLFALLYERNNDGRIDSRRKRWLWKQMSTPSISISPNASLTEESMCGRRINALKCWWLSPVFAPFWAYIQRQSITLRISRPLVILCQIILFFIISKSVVHACLITTFRLWHQLKAPHAYSEDGWAWSRTR